MLGERKVLDEAAVNDAVQATVEYDGRNPPYLRLRPHAPQSYYPVQHHSIVLDAKAVENLLALAARAGLLPKR
jgi:hypothetical protein